MRTNTGQILYIPKIGQRANFQHPLVKGCVGWWPLTDGGGGIAKDIAGTNDGTLGSGVTWEDGATGKTTVFDGTANAKISLTSQPVGGQDFSISAWMNISSSVTSKRSIYCDGSTFTQNYLYYDANNKLFSFDHYLPSGEPNKTTTDYGTDDRWISVVVTQDATTTKIYYDGQLKFTGTAEVYGSAAPTVFNIGSRNGSDSMDGNIQNVRIWDRALSSSEVFELYINPWSGLSIPSSTRYFYFPTTLPLSETLGTFKMRNLSFAPRGGGRTIIRKPS